MAETCIQGRTRHESRTRFHVGGTSSGPQLVVRELPRIGEPLLPVWVARSLNLPVARVTEILDDLEKHMTFLFRNEQGAVTWAYPVTLDRTPHHLTFNTGEQVYAA